MWYKAHLCQRGSRSVRQSDFHADSAPPDGLHHWDLDCQTSTSARTCPSLWHSQRIQLYRDPEAKFSTTRTRLELVTLDLIRSEVCHTCLRTCQHSRFVTNTGVSYWAVVKLALRLSWNCGSNSSSLIAARQCSKEYPLPDHHEVSPQIWLSSFFWGQLPGSVKLPCLVQSWVLTSIWESQ